MKKTGWLIVVIGAALSYGCAGTVPSELVDARQAYQQASEGPAVRFAPTELHKAKEALVLAEAAHSEDSNSYRTRDLAYVALRRAEMAGAQASIAMEQASKTEAEGDYQAVQGALLAESAQDLDETRAALTASQRNEQETSAQLSAEQKARLASEKRAGEQREAATAATQDLNRTRAALEASQQSGREKTEQIDAQQNARLAAEKRASDAQAELTRLSAISEEARGIVITLSGSVLFRSNEAKLMPGSESRLDLVVDALSATPDRRVVVEGYTDSQGSDDYNLALSRRRADAVRDYIVHRGYPAGLVESRGMGEGRPLADNATAEGRANNRRVEIVLERPAKQ